MAQYIIVTGSSNSGKTNTIRTLWESLGGNILQNHDFHGDLTYDGKKIGFHSWGDNKKHYMEPKGGLPDLVKKECSIIICAARGKGQTQEFLIQQYQEANPEFKMDALYWIWKAKDDEMVKSAQRAAMHIKITIDSLIENK